jgi:hypothetical protein
MQAFREASPDRKFGEAMLESTLRSYVKNKSGVTDEQLTEAIRQLISHEFVTRRQLAYEPPFSIPSSPLSPLGSFQYVYGMHYLVAPTQLGENLLEAITGTPTPIPVVPQLPMPSWVAQ